MALSKTRKLLAAITLFAVSAAPAAAQLVGSEPSRSPFRDLEGTQQLTLSTGWFDAANDAAGVGPKPATFFSLRHDILLGGPAWLTTRYSLLRSSRDVIDPGMPANERDFGSKDVAHHIADIGITVALTGRKTWHHVVPTLGAGLGVTSSFDGADVGGYKFGTKFAFTMGPGLRIALPNGYSIRADVVNHVYQFQYPSTYFIAASDSTRVLENTKQRSGWRSNWGFSAGLSVPIFR